MNASSFQSVEAIRLADLDDPEEVGRIERFVAGHPQGTPFHRPAWLRAVERGAGQRAIGLLAQSGDDFTGWLPLTGIHSPFFSRALVSSGFGVGGGALASHQGTALRLCRAAEELAERHAYQTLEIRGGPVPWHWTKRTEAHCNFSADLASDDEAQLMAIPRRQRAEIRKGLKEDLTIETGRSERDRAAHYAVYAESVRNLGTPVFPRSLFDAMMDMFGDEADILTVRHQDCPVASILSLYHRNTVLPYWGGGIRAARRLRANDRMYFELMLHARRRGCNRFDFGRSKTGSGAFHYKRHWGMEAVALTYGLWTVPGGQVRDIDPNSPRHAAQVAMWKRLPLAVANRIGPAIARGLG